MYSRPKYNSVSLARLRTFGEPKIKSFFAQVSLTTQRNIAKGLPSIAGFRPGGTPSIERQLQNLAHRLAQGSVTESSQRSSEELALYGFWRFYALGRLKPKTVITKLLDKLENSSTDDSASEVQFKVVRDSLSALIKGGEATRDQLVTFAEMAPFDDVGGLLALAEAANTEEEAKQASEIRALPIRLEKDEHQIKDLDGKLQRLEDRISASGYLTKSDISSLSVLSNIEISVSALAERISALEKRPHASTFDQDAVKKLQQGMLNLSNDIAKLTSRAEDIEVATLSALELGDRLDTLEKRANANVQNAAAETTSVKKNADENPIAVLRDIPTAVRALTSGYEVLGLFPSQCGVLAEEVLTAVACRQCVTFRGGMSSKVAVATATVLGGGAVREVHIVFGAESTSPTLPESFRDLPSPEVQASALIIHNANFAPAAVCADLVRQIVYPVGIELEGATVVIATMVDTPAAFPAEKINLQLGPIFDTDLMDWKLPKPAVLSHSALSKECIRALEDLGASTLPEADEIRALLGHAAIRRDPKFERNVLQSLAALSKLRPKQDSLTWQQSICFGWILPYWLIRQPAADEIDEAIDGGKCDSQKSDPRLGRILLDLRNSEQE